MVESSEQGEHERGVHRGLGVAARTRLAPVLLIFARRKPEAVAALLLLLMAANCLSVIARKSVTNDENIHIPAGYYHLVAGDFQFNNPHPPPPKMLSALPLLFIQPNEMPEDARNEIKSSEDFERAAIDHFWASNNTLFESISFWTRVPMIADAVLLGIVIFYLARSFFGARAAVLSVALYSLEPSVLAHGRIVHTDLPSALGLLVFCFALYVYVSHLTLWRAVWLGAATGFAPLTKFSMVALAPFVVTGALALIIFAGRAGLRRRAALAHVAALAGVALIVINAAYFFQNRALSQPEVEWINIVFPVHAATVALSVRALGWVVPTDFLMGIYWQIHHSGEGHPAGLLGMHSQFGWWYYFPTAFALKTTVAFLLTSVAAIFWSLWRVIKKRDRSVSLNTLFVLTPFVLFTVYLMSNKINIGVRYYLPAYPFLFIMSGALLDRLWRARARKLSAAIVIIVLGWSVLEAARAYPNYVPYMNQLAFAHPHWWYLSDSNVEWGDDAKELAVYLRARGETRVRGALLGGYWALSHYGVEYLDLFAPPETVPETTYVAIGASFLNGSTVLLGPPGSGRETNELRVDFFEAYRHRTPDAVIGNSIYVFRVR